MLTADTNSPIEGSNDNIAVVRLCDPATAIPSAELPITFGSVVGRDTETGALVRYTPASRDWSTLFPD